MSTIKLKGSSSGEAEVTVAAAAGTPTFTLPTTVGSANQVVKNSGTAGTLEFSSIVDSSGKVGIGTNNVDKNSHSLLNVHRATSDSNYMYFTNTTTGETGGDGFTIGMDGDEKALLWNRENTDMRFGTNGTERLTIKNDGHVSIVSGNLEFANGAGIDFSNVPDGSRSIGTDGNKLDDYEEGTWTPEIYYQNTTNQGDASNLAQYGWYTRVGDICHLGFFLRWTLTGTAVNDNIGVKNIPFAISAITSTYGHAGAAGTLRHWGTSLNNSTPMIVAASSNGQTILYFEEQNYAGNYGNEFGANSGMRVWGSLTYRV